MSESETLRSQKIVLCGQTFPIRTDLSESALAELVAYAQERLERMGVRTPVDDPQRILLPFLVVCGELLEERKKGEELKELARETENRAQKLARLLEISDID